MSQADTPPPAAPALVVRLGVAPRVDIFEGALRTAEDAFAFARAFNAVCAAVWPAEFADDAPEEEAKPKRAPGAIRVVAPGSNAELVLAQIRSGVTDTLAIADSLDMTARGVAALKRMLAAGGHWEGDKP